MTESAGVRLFTRALKAIPKPLLDFAFKNRYRGPFRWLKAKLASGLRDAELGAEIPRGPLSGYRLAFDSADTKIIWMGIHEPEVQQAILSLVTPGTVAFDIGAHVGYYVMLLSKLAAPNGSVVGFEPDPKNYHYLERNIELNGFSSLASASRLAFGEAPAKGRIKHGVQSGYSQVVEGEGGVEISTLDDEVFAGRLPAPSFVLIDTEGAEASILRGASRLLTEFHPTLILEHHDTGLEKRSLIDLLEPRGYRHEPLGPAHLLFR